jgi:ABC-type branched-subunit amino acid transport system ATPase component
MSLEAIDVSVRFGGVTALRGVGVELNKAEVLAVIGPNGSGKSTLFNAITGLATPDTGSILLEKEALNGVAPHRRIARGLARTFQTPRFDPQMTVGDTILCGFYCRIRPTLAGSLLPAFSGRQRRANREARDECRHIGNRLGLGNLNAKRMGELPIGQVRMVELARAVAARPDYLLLDEPAAGLSRREHAALSAQVIEFARSGVGVLLVEHNFSLIRELAGRAVVLQRGEVMLRGTPEEVSRHPEFMAAYLGSSAQAS